MQTASAKIFLRVPTYSKIGADPFLSNDLFRCKLFATLSMLEIRKSISRMIQTNLKQLETSSSCFDECEESFLSFHKSFHLCFNKANLKQFYMRFVLVSTGTSSSYCKKNQFKEPSSIINSSKILLLKIGQNRLHQLFSKSFLTYDVTTNFFFIIRKQFIISSSAFNNL